MTKKMSSTLNRFGSVLKSPNVAIKILVFSLILSVGVVTIDNIVGTQISDLSTLSKFLSQELAREAGPSFVEAREVHIRILQNFINRAKSEPGASFVFFLWPKFDPEARFKPILDCLKKPAESATAAQHNIKEASVLMAQIANELNESRHPSYRVYLPFSKFDAETFQRQIKDFLISADKFQNADANDLARVKLAEIACMDARFATFLTLSVYRGKSSAVDAGGNLLPVKLRELSESLHKFASTPTLPKNNKEIIEHYAQNVNSRSLLLAKLQTGGISQVHELLFANK